PDAKVVSTEGATSAAEVKTRVSRAIEDAVKDAPEASTIVTSSGSRRSGSVKVNGEEVATLRVDYSGERASITWKSDKFKELGDEIRGDSANDMAAAVASKIRKAIYDSPETDKVSFRV